MHPPVTWIWSEFGALTPARLYAALALRQRVFVVEQDCAFLDADGLDPHATHLCGEVDGELAAYLRVLQSGARYTEASIGRVIVAPEHRGRGLGHEAMREALARYGQERLVLSAQAHLERYYAQHGFRAVGPAYEEDGIPHVRMVRP